MPLAARDAFGVGECYSDRCIVIILLKMLYYTISFIIPRSIQREVRTDRKRKTGDVAGRAGCLWRRRVPFGQMH